MGREIATQALNLPIKFLWCKTLQTNTHSACQRTCYGKSYPLGLRGRSNPSCRTTSANRLGNGVDGHKLDFKCINNCMSNSELHGPIPANVAEIIRRCRLRPEMQDDLGIALAQIVAEIRTDQALSNIDRRKHRRERLAALKAFARAQQQMINAVETARPAGAAGLRRVLAPDLGLLLSSRAYGRLLGIPVHPTLSMRERNSRAAALHDGPYGLLEDMAQLTRQEIGRSHGDQLLVAFWRQLAASVAAELEAERLNVGGKPVDRPRRIALIRLLQLHERLTGRPAPSQPSKAIVNFFEASFEAIGLPMPKDGLFTATDRFFSLLRKARGSLS